MNREQKFRVWNKPAKCFVQNINNEIASFTLLTLSDYLKNNSISNIDDFIFQQYTGLTDSKGNEIYEGDILKINDHLLPEKVIFLFGSFGFHLNYKNSKDPRRKDNDSADFYSISEFHHSELEVVGNIFENPELLK